jgi:DNA-binding GntR family transcriptional regulator
LWSVSFALSRFGCEEKAAVALDIQRGERRTAHQLVRDTLRRAILTGKLTADTRLVQSDIAEQLQVSTTPVREALRDLASEGFILLDAHRGAVVRRLSYDDVYEIYDIRKLLEPDAMRRAVEHITDEEIDAAAQIQARADVETDAARWVELNHEFHRVFLKAARSPRLAGILNNLADSSAMYIATILARGERRREDANAHHRTLLEAVRHRDADAAAEVMMSHIHQTVEMVADILPRDIAGDGTV